MTTKIYVFSATGNSLWAAKTLAEKLGGAEVLPVARFRNDATVKPDADRVGLVFPLYFLGMPKIVDRFVRRLDLSNAKYVFAAVSRGFPGMSGVAKAYARTGKRLDYLDYVNLPDNYIVRFDAPAKAKFERLTAKAERKLYRIAEAVAAGRHRISRNLFDLLADSYHAPFLEQIENGQPFFTVGESCNGCAQCSKVCPVGNIRMEAGRPVYAAECEMCMACIHACPAEAIQFGKATAGRKRYVNPLVGWKTLKNFR